MKKRIYSITAAVILLMCGTFLTGCELFFDIVIGNDIDFAIVRATALNSTSIKISWSDPEELDEFSFWEITASPAEGSLSQNMQIPCIINGVKHDHYYTATGLTPNTRYDFSVRRVVSEKRRSRWNSDWAKTLP